MLVGDLRERGAAAAFGFDALDFGGQLAALGFQGVRAAQRGAGLFHLRGVIHQGIDLRGDFDEARAGLGGRVAGVAGGRAARFLRELPDEGGAAHVGQDLADDGFVEIVG